MSNQITPRVPRKRILALLASQGLTPLDWYKQQLDNELSDYSSNELYGCLWNAWIDGCKPVSTRDAWDRIKDLWDECGNSPEFWRMLGADN